MELPTIISFTQSVVSHFFLTVRVVVQKKQGLIEENLFSFGLDNIMFLCAFPGISSIPFKSCNLR